MFFSISARLVAVVVSTGILALGIIGGLNALRLSHGLQEQADALGKLSEEQLAHRLEGEAQLARARLEAINLETSRRAREIAQRRDIAKAVATRNDVTIREPLLAQLARTSNLNSIVAFDERGDVVGANLPIDLIQANRAFRTSPLAANVNDVLTDNSRVLRRAFAAGARIEPSLLLALGLPLRLSIAYIAIEPVFDDFGDTVGALLALRIIAPSEPALENFSSLANVGVVVLGHDEIVSSAGVKGVRFAVSDANAKALLRSPDGAYVAHCVPHVAGLNVCTFTESAVISASRDQMFHIGERQTHALMWQFLIVAAVALAMLVAAILLSVKRSTRGLSHLASTAMSVARGNLEAPFRATGTGEVYSLGLAFERMLETLRESIGRIRQLAYFDSVTGLANREKVRLDARALIESPDGGALFFFDLDAFKSVNDSLGHTAGDRLLKQVADRLTLFMSSQSQAWGGDGILGRIGGDEFVAMMPLVNSRERAAALAEELLATLREPYVLETPHVVVGASIGITFFPQDGTTYEELLVNADLAMYEAKNAGRNTYVFFTRAIADRARERLTIERSLKQAIDRRELNVHYQPKISCKDGSVCGVEALTRWESPVLGFVAPDKFIKIAEDTGQIFGLGQFVLERSLSDIGPIIKSGADIDLAVNVSTIEIEDPHFLTSVTELLERYNFAPTRLEFEITESMATRNPKVVLERIAELRRLGIRFAIDDFGTGYSNLSKLVKLPIDTLKLDRSLINGVATNAETLSVVRVALSLARTFRFRSVVEGVESLEDLKVLVQEGADMAQGFFFSPAVPLAEIRAIIQPHRLVEAFKPRRHAPVARAS
jgi:diguanylate cyclase (GGDEF)-like protein